MIEIAAGDYRLAVQPERGGSISRFDWRGRPVMRATCGPSIWDTACFPLVPFSNRIAFGRFAAGGRSVAIAPNFPGQDHPHPLHGFGWLAHWSVLEVTPSSIRMRHLHEPGAWPWRYAAHQDIWVDDEAVIVSLSICNLSAEPMPAGLGLHPYFPRTDATLYRALHRGEWTNSDDGLPRSLNEGQAARDWWSGRPVGSRAVDTVYTDRAGPIEIEWPERRMTLIMEPDAQLSHTVVYTPSGAHFFCVEPVSHVTDALNGDPRSMMWLDPDQETESRVRFRVVGHE